MNPTEGINLSRQKRQVTQLMRQSIQWHWYEFERSQIL